MSRIDEWYNAANKEYPPQIGYCDMGDIDYNCGYREAFVKGAEWGERAMIEKAIAWLNENAEGYAFAEYSGDELTGETVICEGFIEDFKKAMEE